MLLKLFLFIELKVFVQNHSFVWQRELLSEWDQLKFSNRRLIKNK